MADNPSQRLLSPRQLVTPTSAVNVGFALDNIQPEELIDGALCYVIDSQGYYVWRARSTATPNGVNVIASAKGTSVAGRWELATPPFAPLPALADAAVPTPTEGEYLYYSTDQVALVVKRTSGTVSRIAMDMGVNVLDYEGLVVGGDWTPAIVLAEAEVGSGGKLRFVEGTYALKSSHVQTKTWHFERGATLSLEADLTIDHPVDAAPDQAIFTEAGGIVTAFNAQQKVWANWWNLADAAARWNRMVLACRDNGPTELGLTGTHVTAGRFDLTRFTTPVTFDFSTAIMSTTAERPLFAESSNDSRLITREWTHNDGVT